MDEYIPIAEFCKLTGYKRQTVYNKIYRKEFKLGKHYVKPSRKKILFKRTPIRKGLEGGSSPDSGKPEARHAPQSRIFIQESLPFSTGLSEKPDGPCT